MYFIIFLYVVVVGFFYRVVFGPYKSLGLFHLFYLSYVFSIMVALPAIDNGSEYYKTYFAAALLTPLLFLLGGLAGKVRFFPIINLGKNYLYFEGVLQKRAQKLLIFFLCFFSIYILDVGVSSSGLLFALSNPGDSIAAMEIRMNALSSNVSPLLTKMYGYSRAFLVPFLSCLFLVYWLKGKVNLFRFLLVFFVAVFYSAFSAAKAPVFYLILAMALTYYWWHLHTNPRLASIYLLKLLGVIIMGLLVSSLFYPLLHGVGGGEAIGYAWDQLNHRIFEVPSSVAMMYFEVFGRSIDHLGWEGSSVLSLLFDGEKVSSAQVLYSYFYSNMFSDRGLINAAFFASMYADFGFIIMIFGVVFCGFIVAQVQVFLNKIPFGAISLSCKAICGLAVMQLVLTDFTSILMGRGMLLLPLLLCFFVYLTRHFAGRLRY